MIKYARIHWHLFDAFNLKFHKYYISLYSNEHIPTFLRKQNISVGMNDKHIVLDLSPIQPQVSDSNVCLIYRFFENISNIESANKILNTLIADIKYVQSLSPENLSIHIDAHGAQGADKIVLYGSTVEKKPDIDTPKIEVELFQIGKAIGEGIIPLINTNIKIFLDSCFSAAEWNSQNSSYTQSMLSFIAHGIVASGYSGIASLKGWVRPAVRILPPAFIKPPSSDFLSNLVRQKKGQFGSSTAFKSASLISFLLTKLMSLKQLIIGKKDIELKEDIIDYIIITINDLIILESQAFSRDSGLIIIDRKTIHPTIYVRKNPQNSVTDAYDVTNSTYFKSAFIEKEKYFLSSEWTTFSDAVISKINEIISKLDSENYDSVYVIPYIASIMCNLIFKFMNVLDSECLTNVNWRREQMHAAISENSLPLAFSQKGYPIRATLVLLNKKL